MYDYGYYDYGYGYEETATGLAAIGAGFLVYMIICLAIGIFTLVSIWKVFTKAGKPGWAAIVPIYNIIVMLEIAGLPLWYIALYCIPFANIYAMFKTSIELAHKFGKSTGFGVGIAFLSPIFMGILAFGKDSNYVGGQGVAQPTYQQPVQQPQPVMQPQQPVNNVQPVQPNQTVQPTVNPVPAFCTNCGSQLMPGAAFCTNCGKQQ